MLLSDCDLPADLLDMFLGNVNGDKLAVILHYTLNLVTYENEDDWTPPAKPKKQGTFIDRINTIQFFN